jgi:hypothetical protein
LTRSGFGSDRISAVTSSSRSPGTCHGERRGVDLVERGEGYVDGDAVALVTGLEVIAHGQAERALLPDVRVVRAGDRVRALPHQHRGVEREQVRPAPPLLLPPGVEVGTAHDALADPGVVEVEQRVLVDHDPPPPRPVLELLGLLQELPVGREERLPGVPLAVHERVPDEELARQDRVDLAEADQPVRGQRDAVQGDPLVAHHRGALARPVRLGVAALDQVLPQPFRPRRVDRGVLPAPQARGLDQLGGHHEVRLPPGQARAREDREPGTARTQVLGQRPPAAAPSTGGRAPSRLRLLLQADVREQAGQQGLVDPVVVRFVRVLARREPDLPRDLPQLRLELLPLADPQVVQVLLAAHPAERRRAALLLLAAQVAPEVQPRHEVGAVVAEAGVELVGPGPVLDRPLARVLDRQRGGDHEHLAQTAEPVGLEDHPAQPRVDRQPREPAPDRGQPVARGAPGAQRAQLLEQLDARADVALVGRVDEREPGDVAEAQRRHLEDHAGQVGAEDLRVGELRPGEVVLLGVQPDGDPVGHPPQRPARWLADAWLIGSIGSRCTFVRSE